MPYKTVIRLLGVARKLANGFPARLLDYKLLNRDRYSQESTLLAHLILGFKEESRRNWLCSASQTRFNAVPRSLEVCPGEVGGVGQFGTSAKVVQSLAVGPHFDSLAVKMSTDDGKTAGQAPLLEGAIPALERLESLIATTNAAQVIVLQNVLPKLEHLEKVLAADRAERMTTLKDFEDDETLERLEKLAEEKSTEFDALDFIGQLRLGRGRDLWGREEFHSGVLAWLLDPRQSHGLGDRFLNRFLLRAGVPPASRLSDWTATEVTREWPNLVDGQWGYLDILVVNEAEQVLCAIENKVFSSEHSEQLTRYRKALEVSYSTFTKYHVFLTPWGTLPLREEETEYWTPLTYSTVFEVVQQIAENNDYSTNEGVRAFLRQYGTTVRRNIMPETSVSQLARRIYLEHREAIDQITSYKPDWVSEAKQWLKEAVAQQQWILDVEDTNFVRFRSADWDRYEATQTGSGWAPRSNALLLFQFRFYNGLPWLDLGLSPGDAVNNRLRQKLFEAVRQDPKLFKPTSTALNDGWTILHQENDYILDEADYGVGWDDGTTRVKLEKWIAYFAANQFPAMNHIIVNSLRESESEEQT